jgi:acetylornithine deacetylase
LGIERRTIPGETVEQVEQEFQTLIDELKSEDPSLRIEMQTMLVRDWFEVDESAAIVNSLKQATGQVLGQQAPIIGQHFWTDAAFHSKIGSDTVLIGPTGHGLHSTEEWVEVESVIKLADILANVIIDFCK